MLSFVEISVL